MNYKSSLYENTTATLSRKKKLIITKFKIYIIYLEIIEEEKLYIFLKSKKLMQYGEPLGTTMTSKPNFYYIVYDLNLINNIY